MLVFEALLLLALPLLLTFAALVELPPCTDESHQLERSPPTDDLQKATYKIIYPRFCGSTRFCLRHAFNKASSLKIISPMYSKSLT